MDFYFSGSSIPFYVCLCASPTTILELKFRCDNPSNISLFFFCSHPLRIAWVIWALNVNMLLKILYNEYYYNLSVCYTFIHLSLVEYLNFSYWDWCYNTTNTHFFACWFNSHIYPGVWGLNHTTGVDLVLVRTPALLSIAVPSSHLMSNPSKSLPPSTSPSAWIYNAVLTGARSHCSFDLQFPDD